MFNINSAKLKHTLGYTDRIEFILDNAVSVFYELSSGHSIDLFKDNLLFQITTTQPLLGFGEDFKNAAYCPVLSTTHFLNGKPKTIGFVKAH